QQRWHLGRGVDVRCRRRMRGSRADRLRGGQALPTALRRIPTERATPRDGGCVMGTRADFYVGRGEGATWLGSIAWDGYPEGGVAELLGIKDKHAWMAAVHRFIVSREDGTTTDLGWPWPWEDSNTTDFSYTWDDGVWVTCFGYG